MDAPVVEVVEPEKLENPVENLDKSPDNTPENPETLSKKNGRPKGSKDYVKRVVKPRKKITIVEEPLHDDVATVAIPEAPVVMKTPKPRAVAVNLEPEIRYVDRYIEHSPRSLIRNAHSHIVNEQKSKHDARKERFSDMILRSLR